MAGLKDLVISQSTNPQHFLGPDVLHVTIGLKIFWGMVARVYVRVQVTKGFTVII